MAGSVGSLSKKFTLFTWSAQSGVVRHNVVKAKGIYFWDDKGRKYIDFSSQLVNTSLGHCHPSIVKAISRQIKILDFASPSFASRPKAELGRMLSKLTGLSKSFFTTGGGEANENAILIARQFTQKDIILSRDPSYHGATYGARTASQDNTRSLPTKHRAPGFYSFSVPQCLPKKDPSHISCCQASLDELTRLIRKYRGRIAAVILEPIPGAQGVLIPSPRYLPSLVRICRKNKILVIFDEVMTGFGRTGKWFSYQHWKVKPDILTLSKGINGGSVPLGAAIVSKNISKYFDKNKLLAGLTNSGHPIGCAAAIEAIKIYKEGDLVNRSQRLGKILRDHLNVFLRDYGEIVDVRSLGLFACIEFLKDDSLEKSTKLVEQITDGVYKRGLYLYHRLNTIIISPPLTISQEELLKGIGILEEELVSRFHNRV